MGENGNRKQTDKRIELLVYGIIWLIVFLMPVIHESINYALNGDFVWRDVYVWWIGMISFIVVFLIHNFLFLPYLLLKGRIKRYLTCCVVLLFLFVGTETARFKYLQDRHSGRMMPHHELLAGVSHHGPPPHHPPGMKKGLIPPPILIHSLLAFFVMGCNVGIMMLFKSQRDEEERKVLENMAMREELKYLKSQINPHFFMNMLNNIHSMVEIEPDKAQDMILELSKLMRYVLYEGENTETTFSNEVRFLSSYVSLMRQRYPVDKVDIELLLPETPSDHLTLPPLLFIAFVENAFKHGVSYLRKSRIEISLMEEGDRIRFYCRNTKPVMETNRNTGGVGLDNIRRRLALLYGERASLNIEDKPDCFTVNLTIPCH